MLKKFNGATASGKTSAMIYHMIVNSEMNFLFVVMEINADTVNKKIQHLLEKNPELTYYNNIRVVEMPVASSLGEVSKELKKFPGYDAVVFDQISLLSDASANKGLSYFEAMINLEQELYDWSNDELAQMDVIIGRQLNREFYGNPDVVQKFKTSQLDTDQEGVENILCFRERDQVVCHDCTTDSELIFTI